NTPTNTVTASVTTSFTNTGTPSPTNTGTSSPTLTKTVTPSPSATATGTPTSTFTPNGTATATRTNTPVVTASGTATPGPEKPICYPNPADGTKPVQLLFNLKSPEDTVKLQLFTAAFRKIQETVLRNVSAGKQQVTIELKDQWGAPLANGLYYVIISSPDGRSVGKLLVTR
ncbi:MAG TPA: FlgD immunoglobulin-like domain containing protein, partial [bacterium]